mmetsp:Transcript_15521/g.17223  ORF Transcript_15521/g.17223 Transcript_15521/m.17223 type:complete len:452 (+) Transcript_15521:212-1567(+)
MNTTSNKRMSIVHRSIIIYIFLIIISISSAFLNSIGTHVSSRRTNSRILQRRYMWNLNKINDLRLFSIPQNTNNNNNTNTAVNELYTAAPATLVETIGGGTATIFEMARRVLIWEEGNDCASSSSTSTACSGDPAVADNNNNEEKQQELTDYDYLTGAVGGINSNVNLPRWHPHSGISDVNPSFRTQSPIMNNQGYASTIWRNVRKRNKPSLWRHALRTYDRMGDAEQDGYPVQRATIHHEGALLACAKLGLWQKAIDIFRNNVEDDKYNTVVTDNMIFSVVKACVRGCKKLKGEKSILEERRAPLNAGAEMIGSIQNSNYEFLLVARHLNPLSAAYQSLGLLNEANELIQKHLMDRSRGPEPVGGEETFNVHDVCAKDKASYALLVKGAVASGNWADAVEALEDMTEAGLYPNSRNLNSWTEATERKMKQRSARSWKKKRDEYWLESVGV